MCLLPRRWPPSSIWWRSSGRHQRPIPCSFRWARTKLYLSSPVTGRWPVYETLLTSDKCRSRAVVAIALTVYKEWIWRCPPLARRSIQIHSAGMLGRAQPANRAFSEPEKEASWPERSSSARNSINL